MPAALYIDLPKTHYVPGETVSGKIFWVLDKPPQTIRLTLGWWTEGRGTRDAAIELQQEWQTMDLAGEKPFALTVPPSPYSFSGTLITLQWALELSLEKGKETAVEVLTIGPTEKPIQLSHVNEGGK